MSSTSPQSGKVVLKPDNVQLNVFAGDPIFRNLRKRDVHPNWLFSFTLIFLTLACISAAVNGHFVQNGLTDDICHDVGVMLPGNPRWSCLRHYRSDVSFSLLRDMPSLACLLIIGLIPRLIYKQWIGLSQIFPSMSRDELLSFEGPDAAGAFQAEVNSANLWFSRVGKAGAPLALCAALLAVPIVSAEGQGVFPLLVRGGPSGGTPNTAYISWWASFGNPLSWTFYTFTLAVGAYYIILMNTIGFRAIMVLWNTRKIVVATASIANFDGAYGWKEARDILAASYIATALYAIALTSMAIVLPVGVLWVLSLFYLQWVLVLPIYLYVPLRQIRKSITAYKRSEIEDARRRVSEIKDSRETKDMEEVQLLTARIESVNRIRTLPFRAFRDVAVALFTIIASAASIYAAATLWYNLQ